MAEHANSPGVDPIEVTPVVVIVQAFPARPSSIPDIRDFVRRCLAESPLTEEGNRQVSEIVFRALLDAAGPTGSIQVAFRIFPENVEVDVLHSDSPLRSTATLTPATAGTPTMVAAPADTRTPAALGASTAAMASAEPHTPARAGETASGTPTPGAPSIVGTYAPSTFSAHAPATVGAPTSAAGHHAPATTGSPPAATANRQIPTPASPHTAVPGSTSAAAGAGDQTVQADTFSEWMTTTLRREGLTHEAAARMLGVSVKTVSRWVGGATEPRLRDLRRIKEVFGQVPLP
ncbi:MAG TPA: helix-turn-helix domain-containing protein [Streptosporangiaceae bacterium]